MKKALFVLSVLSLFAGPAFCAEEAQNTNRETAPVYQPSPLSAGLDLMFTPVTYRDYQWVQGVKNGTTGRGAHLNLEWIPLNEVYGKLGVGIGLGFNWFKHVGLTNMISANLYTVPLESYLSYRLDYFENQALVPFVKVGLSKTLISQDTTSNLGTANHAKTYDAFDYVLGGEFCLNVIDKRAARDLDHSTGINNTYIVFEYVKSKQINDQLDANLSHEEYRIGLRFEM